MFKINGLRCLAVDDNELNRIVIRELLKIDGAVVTELSSGSEAVREVCNSANQYDVVLMDIQMPGMDGLEATRRIREFIPARVLPVIAVTADGAGLDPAALRAAGMQGLLEKPLDSQELLRLLSEISSEHQG
jgi:CheY-like chemotaxis protein